MRAPRTRDWRATIGLRLARARYVRHEDAAALEALDKAVQELLPDRMTWTLPSIRLLRAKVLASLGRKEEARSELRWLDAVWSEADDVPQRKELKAQLAALR